MSYFGYKKQEDPNKSMIDWAGITSKISKEITTVADDRKKQRTDLATEQQKLISDTDVFDQNENPSYNQFLLGGGQDAAKEYTKIDTLMTSGKIPVDQAKIMKQNVKDTWVGMKGTISALDAEYKKLMEDPTAGNLAQAEALENIMNLDSKKVRYDGNSHGYLVEVDKDGNEIEGKRVSIRSLAKNSFKKFEAVDLSAETSKITKDVKAIEMFESATVSNKDPRLRPDYNTWLNASATRILDNDQKIASLLMEAYNVDSSVGSRVGKTRSITYNVITGYKNGVPTVESRTEEIGPVEMKMGEDGRLNPVITKEMREIAIEAAKSDIEMKLMAEKKKKYVDSRANKLGDKEKKVLSGKKLVNDILFGGQPSALNDLKDRAKATDVRYELNQNNQRTIVFTIGNDEKEIILEDKYEAGKMLSKLLGEDVADEYRKNPGIDEEAKLNPSIFNNKFYRTKTYKGVNPDGFKSLSVNLNKLKPISGVLRSPVEGKPATSQEMVKGIEFFKRAVADSGLPMEVFIVSKDGNIKINTKQPRGQQILKELKTTDPNLGILFDTFSPATLEQALKGLSTKAMPYQNNSSRKSAYKR